MFLGIHLYGAGEALRLIFAITALAVVALVVFLITIVPHFDASNLFDIAVTDATGASPLLPFGYIGIWAAIPYAAFVGPTRSPAAFKRCLRYRASLDDLVQFTAIKPHASAARTVVDLDAVATGYHQIDTADGARHTFRPGASSNLRSPLLGA